MIELTLLILISCLAYLLGGFFIDILKLRTQGRAEFILYSVSSGLGLLAVLVMVLGFTGLLYRFVVLPMLTVLLLVLLLYRGRSSFNRLSDLLRVFSDTPLWLKATFLITALYIVYQLVCCMTPVINGDSLGPYLSVPKRIIMNHGLLDRQLTQDYISSNLPLNIYMISVLGLMIKSEILSQLILGWLMSVLCFLAVFVSAKRLASRDYALLGAAIFYTMPTLSWLIFSAKLDLGYTMFELCFWSLFIKWLLDKDKRTLFISAVFLGFAIGSKYHSLIALTCVATIVLIRLLADKQRFWDVIKTVFLFSCISLIIGAPSYIKTWYFKGDPFFPFLSNPGLVEGEGYNIYANIWHYPRFIYNMVFAQNFFWKPMSYADKPIGFLPVLFIPMLFVKVQKRTINSWIKVTIVLYFLLLSSAIMLSVWPFPRHFLPAIALLVVLGAYGAERITVIHYKLLFGWLVFLFLFCTISFYNIKFPDFKLQSKYLLGSISKDAYLERVFSSSWHMNSEMMDFAKGLPEDTRILTLDYGSSYYVPKIFIKKGYVYTECDVQRILQLMKSDRITHIYASSSGMKLLTDNFNHGKQSAVLSLVGNSLMLVYTAGDQSLYKITY